MRSYASSSYAPTIWLIAPSNRVISGEFPAKLTVDKLRL